ncbi:MAG: bifunctional diaminohydroxyphosphoribosylaminopyrimidine deaminase/5-amino-6-(5-phosphoribosylamino)uracil reductase RibD [Candidatus Marinamargulisbacteria bacterium]
MITKTMGLTNFEQSCLEDLLRKTITLRGTQYPNPAVGAMIVDGESIISEGYHRISGEAHAEVLAIKQANQSLVGKTILITLEPCCHQGKTSRCTDHIITAGFTRVIWAINDPNPKTFGKSKAILQSHGIEVFDNVMPELGVEVIQEFYSFYFNRRPFVYVKAAMSLDGFIAPNRSELTYISSKESLDVVQRLRMNVQAICVGANTINVDQPRLSIRVDRTHDFQPIIVIIDPKNDVDLDWMSAALDQNRRIVLFNGKKLMFEHKNLSVFSTLTSDKKRNWLAILDCLYDLSIHAVLIEGGSRIFHSILAANYFDELWITKTPTLLSSDQAVPFISGDAPRLNLSLNGVEQCSADIVLKYKNNDAFSI